MLSSELLGFPADARVLIVNADDIGMYDSINTAIVRSIETGIVSSCSLMAGCPAATRAIELLRERPEIPFGIHLALVCDSADYRWEPLAPKDKVSSLLDDDMLFLNDDRDRMLAGARIDEVELEFRAQIDRAVNSGLNPTHLDFHCLADGGRDDIFDLTVELAAEYGLAVRTWLPPAQEKMRQRGLPVVDNQFLDSYSLDLENKSEKYTQLLHELPVGLTEWAVHPALGDEDSRKIDDGWRVRHSDYEFVSSPAARETIEREGITVIDYRKLQHLWSR
jgi:hypothetical protein